MINLAREKRFEKKYKDVLGATSDSMIHDAFDFDEKLKQMKLKMADFDKELDSFKRRENSKLMDF